MKLNFAPPIIWQDWKQFIAFGLGVGAMPVAPGTFGTLAAMPFFIMLARLPLIYYLMVVIVIFFLACWLCDICSKQIGVHDHSGMVIDEYVGYWITMFAVPAAAGWMWLGFLLFRFFDILKPWPINLLDRHVKGGIGVMLDDALAAIFSCIILHVVMKILM